MKIKDINGLDIEIENLQLATMQADDYRHFRHLDPTLHLMDKRLQAYWEDVYEKLLKIQQEQHK